MSTLLRRLQRNPHFQKQEAPPAPPLDTSALNNAIGELIKQAAAAGAEEAVRKQPAPAPAKPQTVREQFGAPPPSSEWPDPPPTTAAPKDLTVSLTRNEVGRVHKVSIGKVNFVAMRNSDGQLIGMRQED